MRTIQLTQGQVALVDDEDYLELSKYKWCYHKKKTDHTGYAVRSTFDGITKRTVRMHRQIMNLQKGEIADHADSNGLNNTRENLRKCSFSENAKNRRRVKNGSSKYLGVHFRLAHGKNPYYEAHIVANGIPMHIGGSVNEKEAARMYNEAALKHHGEFARLNIIED